MTKHAKRPADAVLFDLFSTLISVSSAAGTPGRHTADILGIGRSQWNHACFSDHHDICRPTQHFEIIRRLARSIKHDISDELIEIATTERQQRFDHALINVEPEILQTLQELRKRKVRLGLISNASTDEVRAWQDSPLAPFFDTVLFSCHCGLKKPDSDIYLAGLHALKISADRTLFVGDGGSEEHLGAFRAGIPSLLVTHFLDSHSEDELTRLGSGSRARISHIRELLHL